MKKLLYNKSRTKIFNIDNLISIELLQTFDQSTEKDRTVGIILKFSSEDYFLITPGDRKEAFSVIAYNMEYGSSKWRKIFNSILEDPINPNAEKNKKLFEFFEHKFTRSSLCQNR